MWKVGGGRRQRINVGEGGRVVCDCVWAPGKLLEVFLCQVSQSGISAKGATTLKGKVATGLSHTQQQKKSHWEKLHLTQSSSNLSFLKR